MNFYLAIANHSTGKENILFFKKSNFNEPPGLEPELDISNEEEAVTENLIICRLCNNIITKPSNILDVEGNHIHTFSNPEGVVYRIGCFKEAVGCIPVSEPTYDFTWFPGYRWSVVVCANCLNHLGWHYSSDSSSFFGLVLAYLTENI